MVASGVLSHYKKGARLTNLSKIEICHYKPFFMVCPICKAPQLFLDRADTGRCRWRILNWARVRCLPLCYDLPERSCRALREELNKPSYPERRSRRRCHLRLTCHDEPYYLAFDNSASDSCLSNEGLTDVLDHGSHGNDCKRRA